jgi:hypothetical protein
MILLIIDFEKQIRTQQKLVHLGCLLPPELPFKLDQIGSNSVSAIYYSDPRTIRNYTVGAMPTLSREETNHLATPDFPAYRTEVPAYGLRAYEWFYSEAPLEGVVQAQLCVDKGFCTGVLLQYKDCTRTVGEFRYDKASGCFNEPYWISLIQEQHNSKPRVHVEFLDTDKTNGNSLHAMSGILVWWYGKEISVVTILSSDL